MAVPEGAGRAVCRAASWSEVRRIDAERLRRKVGEYPQEIGSVRLMMRIAAMKNDLAGKDGDFPGG